MSGKSWLYSALAAAAILGPRQLAEQIREPATAWTKQRPTPMWTVENTSSVSVPAARPIGDWPLPHSNRPTSAVPRVTVPTSMDVAGGMQSTLPPQPAIQSLADILRFDVTPEAVTARWPQVWTRRAADGLAGMRVTLVSGTRITDLAGSLTYYFDRQHVVQRIDVDGTCGDPSELIAIATQYYGLQPMPAVGGYQYVAGSKQRIVSGLRIDTARLVRQDRPYERFHVRLELNRPAEGRELSSEFRARLDLPAAHNPAVPSRKILHGEPPPANPSGRASTLDRRRPNTDGLIPHSR